MKIFVTLLFCTTLFANIIVSSSISKSKKWSTVSKNEKVNVQILLNFLKRSQKGKDLISLASKKARTYNKNLVDVIFVGETSLTDTTLYRKFNQKNAGKIEYETKSVVKINKNLSQYDALLDLAHELTHFVHRDEFNPYRLDFTLKKFIKSTIEEKGGEVHAFINECEVLNDLFPNQVHRRNNCKKITDDNSHLSYKHAVEQFYSVGGYYKNLKSSLYRYDLLEDFDEVSNRKIQFVSSAYGVPYPVAALHEYNSVMEKVCENDLNRYSELKQNKAQRSIASINLDSFKTSILKRCKNYL